VVFAFLIVVVFIYLDIPSEVRIVPVEGASVALCILGYSDGMVTVYFDLGYYHDALLVGVGLCLYCSATRGECQITFVRVGLGLTPLAES
jgi:hypothetical protein